MGDSDEVYGLFDLVGATSVAEEVHDTFNQIDISELLHIIRAKNEETTGISALSFIKRKTDEIINEHFEETEKGEILAKMGIILDHIKNYDFKKTVAKHTSISKFIKIVLNYVSKQPADFQKAYIDGLVKEITCAYDTATGSVIEGSKAGLSCVSGVVQRFVLCLRDGIQISKYQPEEYISIRFILSEAVLKLIIDNYENLFKKLYSFSAESPLWSASTNTEKRASDYKKFMHNELEYQKLPKKFQEKIDEELDERISNYKGWDWFDDDYFPGGRKYRKTRRQKNGKIRKSKKGKGRKSKKYYKKMKTRMSLKNVY